MDLQHAPTDITVSDEGPEEAHTGLNRRWLVLVRVICIVLVVYTLGFFGTGLVLASAQHRTICSGLTCVLPIPEALVYFTVAALIFWRKSDDWMALLVALMLVLIAPISTQPGEVLNFLSSIPVMQVLLSISVYLAFASFLLFWFLFPSGRFVPHWTAWVVTVSLLWLASLFIPSPGNGWLWALNLLILAILLFTVMFVQIHHYYAVSNSIERQQTKWAIVGTIIAVWVGFISLVGSGPTSLIAFTSFIYGTSTFTRAILLLIPLSIGIAILRYRLYDIDVLINRTLIYGTLTGMLILVYFGLVFALQFLLRGLIGQTNDVTIVVSTLAVAALFQPLRRRIQQIIDRRFYRRKYDAARILAAFSAQLQGELDLERLSEQLVTVVQETMQPAHVSLWLQKHGRQVQQQYALVTAEQVQTRQTMSYKSEIDRARTSEEMPRPPFSRISRRAVILGLAAGGIVLAGGVFSQWLLRRHLIFTYTGHTDIVYDAVWSPDGKRVASCSKDKTVQVWDASDGSHVFTYRGHTYGVWAVAWSPDGRRIASGGGDNTVQVWNATNGHHVFTYTEHIDWVKGVAWSPNSTRIASASSDHTVQVWDAANGGHVFVYNSHTNDVGTVAWSPDGTRIASSSYDDTVQIWSPR